MFPILFELPLPTFLQELLSRWFGAEVPSLLPIPSFGIMLMVAFMAGLLYATRLARLFGRDAESDPRKVGSLGLFALIGMIVGGRLLYVAVHYPEFQGDITKMITFWRGGMVFYGGFFMALGLGLWQLKTLKMEVWATADYLIVAGMLGYGLGRIGCFLAGDDYGILAEDASGKPLLPWAIKVPDPLPPKSQFSEVTAGHYLHPTQLYMAFSGFAIAGIGRWFLPRRKFAGQVFWMVILLYAMGRFFIEDYRADDFERGIFNGFSTSQWISMGSAGLSIVMLVVLWRKNISIPEPFVERVGLAAYESQSTRWRDPDSLATRLENASNKEVLEGSMEKDENQEGKKDEGDPFLR